MTIVLSIFHILDLLSQIVLIEMDGSLGMLFTDSSLEVSVGKYAIYTVLALVSSYLVMIPWVGSPMVMLLGVVQYVNYDK